MSPQREAEIRRSLGPVSVGRLRMLQDRCRYCGDLRPAGYTVTCGDPDCADAAQREREVRR